MYLLIYCAGGAGKEICDLAERINTIQHRWDEILFIDDVREEKEFYGRRVLNYNDACCLKDTELVEVIIANGEPFSRKALFEKLESDRFTMANLIHPSAIVSPSVELGKGIIIYEEVAIGAQTQIQNNVFLQPQLTIGHNCLIGQNSVISSHVAVSGDVTIEKEVYIAPMSAIKNDIFIGKGSIIGMGAIVVRNVKEKKIMHGNPAKVIGTNDNMSVFHVI